MAVIAVIAFMLLPDGLSAQVYSTGRESKKADVNFTELSDYYMAHPMPLIIKLPFDEDEEEDEPRQSRKKIDPSKVHLINRAGRGARTTSTPLPATPSPTDTFLSTLSNGTDIPPDTHGAVDSEYCVSALNTEIHIQTRTGGNVRYTDLDAFWNAVLPSGDEAYDPRIHYDPYYKRWIMVTDAVNNTTMGDSYIMVAVSATNDPTGTWHMYSVSIDATDTSWLDFPCLGFNNKWITVSGNMFNAAGRSLNESFVYVFNYADIMAGTGAPFTKIKEAGAFTLCPSLTFDSSQSSMFAIEVNNAGAGKLQLWKITGPVGTPVLASVGFPATTQHWHNGGSADFVPQLGTTNLVQAGDDRITNLTYRNHTLWCAHTVFLPDPGTASRCSVMWWQIDTLANPLQNGLIDDATTPTFFDYPSIAVNVNNDALVGFGYLSANIYPSAAFALHMHTDPADSMRAPYVFRHGQANYYQTFGGTQNRWGDFSATCVDPRDYTNFWTIQESVPAKPINYWDTWWAYVKICPPVSFTVQKDTVGINVSDTIYVGPASSGGTFTWNLGGGTAVPGTGIGPQAVTWTTFGWKVVTLEDSTVGCPSSTFKDSVLVKYPAGVNPLATQNEAVKIVPNPNDGSFDVVFTEPLSSAITVKVVDIQGRVVYANEFNGASNGTLHITTDHIPPGNYTVSIYSDGFVATEKITVVK